MVAFMKKTCFSKCKTVQIFTYIDTVVLAIERLSSLFATPKLPYVGRLNIMVQLKRRHSKHYTVPVDATKSKLFFKRLSDKLCRDLVVLNRKQCRLVRGLLINYVGI
jgi:hypothetical protein